MTNSEAEGIIQDFLEECSEDGEALPLTFEVSEARKVFGEEKFNKLVKFYGIKETANKNFRGKL